MRDNETGAAVSGVYPAQYKVLAFATSALVTSIGGGCFALAVDDHRTRLVRPARARSSSSPASSSEASPPSSVRPSAACSSTGCRTGAFEGRACRSLAEARRAGGRRSSTALLLVLIIFFMPGGVVYGLRWLRSKFLLIRPRLPASCDPRRRGARRRGRAGPDADRVRTDPPTTRGKQSMTRRTTRVALAAVVCLSLVAAACGDDDDDDAASGHHRRRRPRPRLRPTRGRAGDHGSDGDDRCRVHRDHGRRRGRRHRPRRPPTARRRPARPSRSPPTTARADATEALADGEPIKIGFVGPQTGPLAAFGVIGQGMQVIFNKVNEDGGVDGHPLELITKDDAYDPARSAPAVQEAIEGDGIFASVFQVGTPERRRHPSAARRCVRAAGARRHRLPGLG